MSAESPHKSTSRGGHVVAPQPVSDRSIIESVAGFINEVVPQAYTSLPQGEGKEAITWARFEYGDINDPALYPDTADDRSCTPPLLLVLGYGSGVQVWSVPANGDATEVLSWRQGVVRTLRVLPTPLADSPVPDCFALKRPLVALCDSAGPGPQFCSLSFISLRCGDQVKSIKFKNPVSDVLANRHSVVVTFSERIAVFDACTLEDRLTVTTCYPCPGPNPNPVTLGSRWLAYAERNLLHSRRSSGGSEGEGVQSYTATVLHAAKSLGKGLRELGETVASSLTGAGATTNQRIPVGVSGSPGTTTLNTISDTLQPGVVTILDAEGICSSRGDDSGPVTSNTDLMVAHFAAHSEPIVALQFDPSGMLLLTADKRGHDFHVFRIQPHPNGSSLAAVHHLYVLHRGDTTAKVQDVAFAADSRWVAVSTLRGTTHVFPITPYGGSVGIRTHTTPHVVNRLSRFHRSAGLTADGRNSPVPTGGSTSSTGSYESTVLPPAMPYPNPRLPPYPHPTVINPLAQIRQPITQMLSGMTPISPTVFSQQTYHRNPSSRMIGRSQSVSDDGSSSTGLPLRVAACFAAPRAWLVSSPTVPRESSSKMHKRSIDSLFVMACHGSLIQYDLDPKHAAGIPKEKICDDTAIELEVKAKAQWLLLRPPHSCELQPPLPASNPLMVLPDHLPPASESRPEDIDERWLSQVEIVTHAGPHRRLWMGPQFTFKTYTSSSVGAPLSLLEMEAVEIGTGIGTRPARSNPVNMPLSGRPVVPVLIESGSASSYEQSPRLLDAYGGDGDSDGSAGPGDSQLREDLADAMMESPGVPIRDTGRRSFFSLTGKKSTFPVEKVVNPVGTVITVAVPSDEEAGGPPSPAANSRDCERVLPADIGKIDIDVVRWQSNVECPEIWDKPLEKCSKQITNKHVESKQSVVNSVPQNVNQNLTTNTNLSLKGDITFVKINDTNFSQFGKTTRVLDTDSKQGKNSKRNKIVSPKEELENTNSDYFSLETSDIYYSGQCLKGQRSSLIQQTSMKEPTKSDRDGFSEIRENSPNSSNTMLLRKKLENTHLDVETCRTDEFSVDLLVTEERGVSKKKNRGNGRRKLAEDTPKSCSLSAISDSSGSQNPSFVDKKCLEEKNTENPKKVDVCKAKGTEQMLNFSETTKTTPGKYKKSVSSISPYREKCLFSDQVSTDMAENEPNNLKLVSQEDKHSKLPIQSKTGVNNETKNDTNLDKNNRRKFLFKEEKSCFEDEASTSFHVKLKPKLCSSSEVESDGVKTKEVSKETLSTIVINSLKETCVFEECSEIITPNLPNENQCEEDFTFPVEENSVKSLGNILSSSFKTEISPKCSVGFYDPDCKSSATSSGVSFANDSQVTWNNKILTSSSSKEDSKNNNQQGEEVHENPGQENSPSAPHRSWSSIVSSPKPGTSSSTDEGSGGYESNESKDSADLALNTLDDKAIAVDRSETTNIYKPALNCDARNLEDEVSDDVKVVIDEEIAADPSTATSSSKKNRRTKKKRR